MAKAFLREIDFLFLAASHLPHRIAFKKPRWRPKFTAEKNMWRKGQFSAD